MKSVSVKAEQQIEFLNFFQRIFSEGKFSSSYKFALLMAIADLCVQKRNVGGATLKLGVDEISEKFIQYYWRQSLPFSKHGITENMVLNQNRGRYPLVVSRIRNLQHQTGRSLGRVQHSEAWYGLRDEVTEVIKDQPLDKLQTLSNHLEPYLYVINEDGNSITLNEGVAYNFRYFYPMIKNTVRGAWVNFVLSVKTNKEVLGRGGDLEEFLFGTGRTSLARLHEPLKDIQSSKCFYCESKILGQGHIDHFVPWALYPFDLGHNFVLADRECNRHKQDYLPSEDALEKWLSHESVNKQELATIFSSKSVPHNFAVSMQIAKWAYEQADFSKARIWTGNNSTSRLIGAWRYLNWPGETDLPLAAD